MKSNNKWGLPNMGTEVKKATILYFVHYTEGDNFAIIIKEHGRK